MKNSIIYGFILTVTLCSAHLLQAQKKWDVCVYGETPAGITAAIQAARMHKQVVLISNTAHLGGMAASGLTATDLNNFRIAGGLTRDFYRRLYAYYSDSSAWRSESRDTFFERSKKRTYSGKNDSLQMQWVYESHVGEDIFRQMLQDAGVQVAYNERLHPAHGVEKEGARISAVRMENGRHYPARMFIDATYEGDLMARAGVSYIVGRESNSVYNETLNGIKLNGILGRDGVSIDPYIKKGDPSSGILPFLEPHIPGSNGEGDHRTQAYCYRLTLTDDPDNRIAIAQPAGYQPLWYEFLARFIAMNPGIPLKNIISFTPMPNKKTDTNHADFVGANYAWPEAGYATRDSIAQMHKDYALGLLWFLGNDPRLPEAMRMEMKRWGLPKDEFTDNGHFPYQLYVREARRMVSDYVMTEKNCNGQEPVQDAVAVATYPLDCHYVSRVVDEQGRVHAEGSYGKQKSTYYTISYRSLRPRSAEAVNLLVPVCLSASHVAYSSIRMEPVYMVLGQSAGTAAALALDRHQTVQELPYEVLKPVLLKDGQVLTLNRK
ncbi:FAD-dependent oxidoreductase [Chitinophaga japonensis]|uniref:FAD dependent oxidoreductase n=1 Tax=Chitinophaga japonensis TaxID=104662 RepID=A0A562T4S5_CHIJA|nr:FAD-dependent oxidoreductase [Chitinophaga japonensis]TWI88244.1 FAD dependent oxidoreductase [Chitinophaga japonensis]